jgi:hypothetical protein
MPWQGRPQRVLWGAVARRSWVQKWVRVGLQVAMQKRVQKLALSSVP